MKTAVIQMLSGRDIEHNLLQAQTCLADASRAGAQLALLPENFALFAGKGHLDIAQNEAKGSGPVLPFLENASRELGMWIVAGTVPLLAEHPEQTPVGKVYAASTVWNPEGHMVARYDKCHLFDVEVSDSVGRYRESDTYAAGDAPVLCELPWGLMGLSICYDLRFPELYRQLRRAGAAVFTVPSAFTYATGKAHWETLLCARAVENQCYVLAANQGGEHASGRTTWGHSCIVDPWGEILAVRREPGPGFVMADLSMSHLQQVRERMPCEQHRRF